MSIKCIIVQMVVAVLVTLTACTSPTEPTLELPTKPLPAYTINIDFLTQQGVVTVKQGGSVAVPVTVTSLVDQPINIQLVLVANIGQLPEFLKYSQPNDRQFVALAPNSNLETQITITVSDDAPVGDYRLGIAGQLQEPVKDRSNLTQMFDFVVTAK